MGIYLWDTSPSKIYVWWSEVASVRAGDTKVRPSWPDKDYLCFTAEEAASTLKFIKQWSQASLREFEISYDWTNWSAYTIWDTITLSNVWGKVYWRNSSETDTRLSTESSSYYYFQMTWTIWASWDIWFLLCKNSTNTITSYSFNNLFQNCSSLTSAPSLPATTINTFCYRRMFRNCTNLISLPKLPATALKQSCYYSMFQNCSNIKLSSTQTWDYQTPYRIPTEWTWTTATNWNTAMFSWTWWTFTSAPIINTTYYTSNTVV